MNLETELRKALEPVLHWYQSDEGSTRELMDIVRDVVADLQRDRADALKARKLSECVKWLNLMPTIQEGVSEAQAKHQTFKIMPAQAEHTTTARGFGCINFEDAYGAECSLQISSASGSEEQPLGYLWLGVNDADPKIMKTDAFRAGMPVPPGPIEGWMPFAIPEDVLLTTRMHLGEAQVRLLLAALEQWLETCTISPAR